MTLLVLLTTPTVIMAQQVKPAGVVAVRHFGSETKYPFRTEVAISVDSAHGHPWRWVGTGALLGAATGGVTVAVSASRTDDAFFVGPAIGLAAVAGAVVGGLLGGLAYLVFH
jgi:hypothetical protein